MNTLAEKQDCETKKEKLEDLVSHVLEEARMVLPGVQALLGFQLIAVFNTAFNTIHRAEQYLHLAAIFLSVNAICFLLTPAAIHRQSEPDIITVAFARTASKLICMGMLPLLLSIVIDSYVVANVVLDRPFLSAIFAGILFCELSYFWIIMPQMRKRRHTITVPEC